MEYEADETMSFITIKNVLYNRYQIDTQSAGLFFRNQLKAYDTEGGNRNKMVLVGSKRVECISSTLFIVLPESVRAYFLIRMVARYDLPVLASTWFSVSDVCQ